MNSHSKTIDRTSLAALVAHEDLKIGDYVAVLSQVVEFASFMWCDSLPSAKDELVRLRYHPADGGMPLKIKAICLPFVYVKSAKGSTKTIDIRQVQFVRLKKQYAKTIWRDQRKRRAKKKKLGDTSTK